MFASSVTADGASQPFSEETCIERSFKIQLSNMEYYFSSKSESTYDGFVVLVQR